MIDDNYNLKKSHNWYEITRRYHQCIAKYIYSVFYECVVNGEKHNELIEMFFLGFETYFKQKDELNPV